MTEIGFTESVFLSQNEVHDAKEKGQERQRVPLLSLSSYQFRKVSGKKICRTGLSGTL